MLAPLAGTPYADVPAYGRAHADEGLLVYLEVCEFGAYNAGRLLHGLRYAGWFEHANAVLIGRTPAPDADDLTQLQAVEDALGGLGIPIVAEMDIGHTQPFLPLVNGASARVVVRDGVREVTQTLGWASGRAPASRRGPGRPGRAPVWSSGCAVGPASSGPSTGSSVR